MPQLGVYATTFMMTFVSRRPAFRATLVYSKNLNYRPSLRRAAEWHACGLFKAATIYKIVSHSCHSAGAKKRFDFTVPPIWVNKLCLKNAIRRGCLCDQSINLGSKSSSRKFFNCKTRYIVWLDTTWSNPHRPQKLQKRFQRLESHYRRIRSVTPSSPALIT